MPERCDLENLKYGVSDDNFILFGVEISMWRRKLKVISYKSKTELRLALMRSLSLIQKAKVK